MKSVLVNSWFPLLAIVVLVAGCRSPVSIAYRGLDDNLRTHHCRAYRVETQLAKNSRVPQLYGYERLDGPILVSKMESYQLSKLFLTPAHYRFEPVADLGLCGFEPFCVLRFGKLDLVLSLACDKLQVRHEGKIVNMLDVTPMHDAALPIMKTIFEDDAYVKLLQPLPKRE